MDALKYAFEGTNKYLEKFNKSERKKIGQFFTPQEIARYMGALVERFKPQMRILDPGAGSGILSIGLTDRLIESGTTKKIELIAYENNPDIVPILKDNLEYASKQAKNSGVSFEYKIVEKNFIVENFLSWTGIIQSDKFDVVISNPPYKKISKSDRESSIMDEIVHGQPNLYFLFMAMGAKLLAEDGELIYIVPRSFSSGLYFTKFRQWFFSTVKLSNIHMFVSRNDVFDNDKVLQETIIIKAIKTQKKRDYIKITESSGKDFSHNEVFYVPYKNCVTKDKRAFLFLPTNKEDIDILGFVNAWQHTLEDLGYKLKTGLVVDFREKEHLREKECNQTIPLFWPYNIKDNSIIFPIKQDGKPQYLLAGDETKKLQMPLDNYIILKRFTSKEEKRRLQCALLMKDQFEEYESISTENHLNFICNIDGSGDIMDLLGIYVVLNSTYMDKYFRILNGSTQVNANEVNSLPFPSRKEIRILGEVLSKSGKFDENTCDLIIESIYGKINEKGVREEKVWVS